MNVPDGIGETVGPGIPLKRLEKLDVLVLRLTASGADLEHLFPGARVTIRTTSGKEGQGGCVRSLGPWSWSAAGRLWRSKFPTKTGDSPREPTFERF